MVAISRNYSRQSIILSEQDGGFRADNSKVPAGYSKIEVRSGNGILTAFAQNLKYFADGSYIYKFFIAKTDPQPVLLDLGTLVIDDRGKGEGVWKFDAHNVGNTGHGIDKFNLFGVMAYKDENGVKGLICPLAGSSGKMPARWREALEDDFAGYDKDYTANEAMEERSGCREPEKEDGERPAGLDKDTPEFQDAEIPVQETKDIEEENSETPVRETESIEEENAEIPAQETENTEREEEIFPEADYAKAAGEKDEYVQEIDVPGGAGDYDAKALEKNGAEAIQDYGAQNLSWEDANPGLQEYMSHMLGSFPKVDPFEVPLENCVWWKINTFDYIFGIMDDRARKLIYYAYGVPGINDSQIKKQMEIYGFYSWRPAKREEKRQGDYGYWLAFVDARTGILVNPQV